jgi:hypothetical protein
LKSCAAPTALFSVSVYPRRCRGLPCGRA